MKQKIIFIVGPTAVGKSEIAVRLAKKLKGEIISCDSMQVYRKMDILTSKPCQGLRDKIPHHLVDILPVNKEYDVSTYRKQALKNIKNIFKRGKLPIFVGGTGLYMTILIDGIFEAKVGDARIRNRLYKISALKGNRFIYNRLKKVDPEAAGKIHPNDKKRIIRALEVFESLGKPISLLQKQRRGLKDEHDISIFCLNMNRPALYKRIDQRVDRMFKQGMVNEVRGLLRLKLSKTASCAIGIRELKEYFDGACDLHEARCLIKHNTRHYAKRQLTWFRKDKRLKWINISDRSKPAAVAEKIFKKIHNK